MRIEVEQRERDVAVVQLEGRLDFLSASAARDEFARVVQDGTHRIVVDLGDVAFIDSSGLGSLIGGLKVARQAGGDLRLARPTEQARSVLKLTSLDRVFQAHGTIDEALAAYRS
jgi:anti-sigma B factor antagonist